METELFPESATEGVAMYSTSKSKDPRVVVFCTSAVADEMTNLLLFVRATEWEEYSTRRSRLLTTVTLFAATAASTIKQTLPAETVVDEVKTMWSWRVVFTVLWATRMRELARDRVLLLDTATAVYEFRTLNHALVATLTFCTSMVELFTAIVLSWVMVVEEEIMTEHCHKLVAVTKSRTVMALLEMVSTLLLDTSRRLYGANTYSCPLPTVLTLWVSMTVLEMDTVLSLAMLHGALFTHITINLNDDALTLCTSRVVLMMEMVLLSDTAIEFVALITES